MSQDFHQGIFSFSNELNRATAMHQNQHQQQQQHMAIGELPVYETGGMTMLSEMFSFQAGVSPTGDLLENQIKENYRLQRPPSNEWFGNRYGLVEGFRDTKQHHSSNNDDITIAQHHPMSGIHANSATAMQLFHMNPQPRSPSPTTPTSATPLHLLHPIPSTQSPSLQEFHPVRAPAAGFSSSTIPQTQFTWISSGGGGESTSTQLYSNNRNGGGVEGQGLSLSLSSLQHLEAVKAEEFRMGDSGMVYHNQGSSSSYQTKDLGNHHQHQPLPLQGMVVNQDHQVHVGYSSSFGVINLLRNSKYAKAAQDLLEEFCSVGRGQMKNIRLGKQKKNSNTKQSDGEPSSSLSKDLPPLSAAERIEYQRKKAALLSMLDEVDRRYNYYSEQMQMVVNSFDSVMGYAAATPYTVLAQKAMSRHFRCLKDAIVGKLKEMREIVGEKDGTGSSITKGETPKLKLIDQSLRQQRAFQQMGLMEQEAWRPQRGLPERSVTLLRAWLFEHFLHPYPSDADKHLLARQTGLSRNQVSNWFINARVRLWKPMVEEMYLQESKEEEEEDENGEERTSERSQQDQSNNSAQTPTPSATTTTTTPKPSTGKRSEINATENDHSSNAINAQCSSENQATTTKYNDMSPTKSQRHHQMTDDRRQRGSTVQVDFGTTGADTDIESSLERFGISTGDVSLTLGLQHNGNLPENNRFSVSNFGSC